MDADFFALFGIAISLAVIAWSGWTFASQYRLNRRAARFDNYYAVLERVVGQGQQNSALMIAAIHELSRYPEYKAVTVRILENSPVTGDSIEKIKTEMSETMKILEKAK
jgi:hypothetical protein